MFNAWFASVTCFLCELQCDNWHTATTNEYDLKRHRGRFHAQYSVYFMPSILFILCPVSSLFLHVRVSNIRTQYILFY